MSNITKYPFSRQIGHKEKKSFEIFAEDGLVQSKLVAKPLSLPSTTKTTFFMTISPDGKYIASAHGDHCIYVCNVLDGKIIHRLVGHPRSPWSLAFHPGRNDLLASGCLGGEVRVWDLKTGCSAVLRLDNDYVLGRRLAPTGAEINSAATSDNSLAIASVAFHPEERLLAIAAGDRVIFWEWSSKCPKAECRTASRLERVRYVHFDRTGVLYTGITNLRIIPDDNDVEMNPVTRTTIGSAPLQTRCRELLTSRSELLSMRAELLSRREQYDDLLRHFRELREWYVGALPDSTAHSSLATSSASTPRPAWLNETNPDEHFVSLMEQNRHTVVSANVPVEDQDGERSSFANEPRISSNGTRANAQDRPAPLITSTPIENNQGSSYYRLCQSYRTMAACLRGLIIDLRGLDEEARMMEEGIRGRTSTVHQTVSQTRRAVSSCLNQIQQILSAHRTATFRLSTDVAEDEDINSVDGEMQRAMSEVIRLQATSLLHIHETLSSMRNGPGLLLGAWNDISNGRDRVDGILSDLRGLDSSPNLEHLTQRMINELRYLSLAFRHWKRTLIGSGVTLTQLDPVDGDNPVDQSSSTTSRPDTNNSITNNIIQQVPVLANDSYPGSADRPQGRNSPINAPCSSATSNASTCGLPSSSRKRPATEDSNDSTDQRSPLKSSTPTSLIDETANLGTGLLTSPGSMASSTAPRERDGNSSNETRRSQAPAKRSRLDIGDYRPDQRSQRNNRNTPRTSTMASFCPTGSTSDQPADHTNTETRRRERPNIVLFVPRESSRLSSTAGDSPTVQFGGTTGLSGDGNNSRAQETHHELFGAPPRFERLPFNPTEDTWGSQEQLGPRNWDRLSRGTSTSQEWRSRSIGMDVHNNVNSFYGIFDRSTAALNSASPEFPFFNNHTDITCRIQRWPMRLTLDKCPNLTESDQNVILTNCKLHSSGSVSFNESETLLAAFVGCTNSSVLSILQVISLRPEDMGAVLYQTKLGPGTATSISFSPVDGRHVLVGMTSTRCLHVFPPTYGVVYALCDTHDAEDIDSRKPRTMKLVATLGRSQLFAGQPVGREAWWRGYRSDGVNCLTWLPTPGQGLCCGTNRGHVCILTPKPRELDLDDNY